MCLDDFFSDYEDEVTESATLSRVINDPKRKPPKRKTKTNALQRLQDQKENDDNQELKDADEIPWIDNCFTNLVYILFVYIIFVYIIFLYIIIYIIYYLYIFV